MLQTSVPVVTDTAVPVVTDGLMNVVSGLGTARDKVSNHVFVNVDLTQGECEALYLGDGFGRKIVDLVPQDMTREWRNWQAKQAEALLETEAAFNVRAKVCQAETWARLYGGAAILIGDGATDPRLPLDVTTIAKGGLRYLHVFSRWDLATCDFVRDLGSRDFGLPERYRIQSAELADPSVEIHRSRFVIFDGYDVPRLAREANQGWGASVFQAIRTALVHAAASAANAAAMTEEAKLDVITKQGLTNSLADPEGERRLINRFVVAGQMKSIINTLLLDADETFDRKQLSFAGLPELIATHLEILAGVADIPVTKLLGTAPKGMNATGESDTRNYYDSIRAKQTTRLGPTLRPLDEALIRHTLGRRPRGIAYEWAPLWQPTPAELADIADKRAKVDKVYAAMGLFPAPGFGRAVLDNLIATGVYPTIDQHVAHEELDKVAEEQTARKAAETKALAEAKVSVTPPAGATTDAAPRSLYVCRPVTNAREILAWARRQGIPNLLPPDDLHVTIAYSRAPVDWFKAYSDCPEIEIPEGGARLVERLGESAVVLLFASDRLQWRWQHFRDIGASWDHDGYQPHVTLTYDGSDLDLADIAPFEGKIVLGAERFREIEDDLAATVTTSDAHPFFRGDSAERRGKT